MIDGETGQIKLKFDCLSIGPSLTREEFLSSPSAAQCPISVKNEPFCTFELPKVQYEGNSFVWCLCFYEQALDSIHIQCSDPKLGTSWSNWSEEQEMAKKALHDFLLESALGKNWKLKKFRWGEIGSEYNPKSGFSGICIRYSQHFASQSARVNWQKVDEILARVPDVPPVRGDEL